MRFNRSYKKVADDIKSMHNSPSKDQIEAVYMNNACEGYQPHAFNESCKQIEKTRKEDTPQAFDDESASAEIKEQQMIENTWIEEDMCNSENSFI
ncbi:hypothetical protein G6F37_010731 [Rhizopus arrhizus]|nr:hypothetical protein G6F38_011887 [Rhizopus arrhizus]KAG1152887.1 hypothetical protein G6F37_010731 [Rhizopus arrhizus]